MESRHSAAPRRDSFRQGEGAFCSRRDARRAASHLVKLVVYHCEADVELVGAAKYYQCQREQLGRRFLHAVHVALSKVQEDPERYPFYEKPTRACRVLGFPYRLVYEELPDAIYIIAVAHVSREPGYWR